MKGQNKREIINREMNLYCQEVCERMNDDSLEEFLSFMGIDGITKNYIEKTTNNEINKQRDFEIGII